MADPLATYLHDHLGGSKSAVALLEVMRDEHAGEPLGQFAAEMLREVEQDRTVLKGLIARVGDGSGSWLKEALGWVGQRVSRIKLRRRASGGLGTLQSLETLALGIQGKKALWHALSDAAVSDTRIKGVDYQALAQRADRQHDQVEARRREAARIVLPNGRR